MSAPDDLPSLSRIRKPEESSSSSSSSDSMSQPSTTPPAEPRPSTSNGHESGHTRSGHSELHSSGQLGNHHSRRPSTGRSSTDSRSSASGGRSSHGDNTVRRLSSMRDRVLISNANAMARGMSLNELDDTTTTSSSSPSPHMNGNGHSNTDDDQQSAAGMSNGSRKKKKKKNKQWHRSSDDSDLMGFTGLYPNLSRATNQVLDGNPGLESQTSDELRALSRRGLMVYPREAQGSEAATAAAAPHPQPPPPPPQSLGTTSPSPMSSPIESSSLSPNSELNRNLTPGPETGLVVPELEQHEPPTTTTTTTTTTSTNLTTTTTTASNSPTAAAATPRAKSVADADADADADAKELQSQSETKTEEEQKEEVVAAGPSTSSVASGKRQGSPLDKPAKERKKRRHDKLKESKYDLSPPQSSRRHKHGESSSSVRSRSRSKSLSSKDLLPKLEKDKSRSKSQESLAKDQLDLSSEAVAKEEPPPEPSPEPDINVKSDSPKSTSVAESETPSSDAVKKPETPSPSAVNPETPNAVKPVTVEVPPLDPPMVDKTESPESSVAEPEAPSTSVAEPEAPSASVAEPAAASSSEVKPMLPPNNAATPSSTTKRKSKAKRSPKGHKLNQSKANEVEPQEPAVMGKRVPKPKVPKGASPPSEGWTSTSAVKGKVHRPSSNGGNPAAGASVSRKSRKMSEMSTGKDSSVWPEKKEISEEDAARLALAQMKPEPQPEPQPSTPMDVGELSDGSEEDDNDDAGSSSSSAMEIAEEVEFPPGQLPPAQLFDEQEQQAQAQSQVQLQEQGQNDPYRELKDMDVVVIGGRKAVFVRGPPERPPMKLVPRPPDLTSYDRIYRKRIQDKRMGQTLAMSVNDAHVGVNVMAAVMRTMNMKERVTMSQVCTSWAMVSRDNRVWNTVILRDTVVKSWHRLLMEMARHRTQELDMRGVTLDPEQRMSSDLRILRPLRILCTDATTNDFLKLVQSYLPRLHELRMTCVSAHLNLTRMEKMRKLRVLRINMTHPKAQIIRLRGLVNLDLLTELIIRGVTNLKESLDLRALKTLRNLRILKLGSCEDLNNQMLGLCVLPCLEELRTLRIENDHKAMTVFPVDDILEGVSAAGEVERLELINVDVDSSFGQLLAKCNTVASLLLAPKCLHNTATMINAVMQAVKDNSDHLITFRLVLVTQLLSATENLYKGTQKNVIPVQRPVPGIPPDDALNHCSPEDNCQEEEHTQCVAFLPVERLEQILNEMMRMGCVSVAKVAMSETTNVQFLERDVSAST